jgi:hypothetical protein
MSWVMDISAYQTSSITKVKHAIKLCLTLSSEVVRNVSMIE